MHQTTKNGGQKGQEILHVEVGNASIDPDAVVVFFWDDLGANFAKSCTTLGGKRAK